MIHPESPVGEGNIAQLSAVVLQLLVGLRYPVQ